MHGLNGLSLNLVSNQIKKGGILTSPILDHP